MYFRLRIGFYARLSGRFHAGFGNRFYRGFRRRFHRLGGQRLFDRLRRIGIIDKRRAAEEELRIGAGIGVRYAAAQSQDRHRTAQRVGDGQRVLAGRRLEPRLLPGIIADRQGIAGIFQINHPGHELAREGQLQIGIG